MPRSSRQSGLVIIWAVLLAPVLLAIAALAIDISLHLVRQHDAKKAADAAAIAASQSFNGSLQGWRDAKRAALAALKNAKVTGYGVLSDLRPLGVLNCTSDEAALDPLELDPNYSCTFANLPDLDVVIERGVLWPVGYELGSGNVFKSLEGQTTHVGLPVYAVSNAAHVSVTVRRNPTFFGKVLGVDRFFDRTRVSIAKVGGTPPDLAPIALPACELYWDHLNADGTRVTDLYAAGRQCEREGVAMEVAWNGPQRIHGVTRALAAPRGQMQSYTIPVDPPVSFEARAIDTLPLRAVFGVPKTAASQPTVLNADEMREILVDYLSPSGSDLSNTLIGQEFRPLEDAQPGSDRFLNNAELMGAVSNWLLGGQGPGELQAFQNVFGSASNPRNNFPHLRIFQPDLTQYSESRTPWLFLFGNDPVITPRWYDFTDLFWAMPTFTAAVMYPLGNLVPSSNPNRWARTLNLSAPQNVWSSPLCHNQDLPWDDPNQNVRVLKAMVIAPSVDNDQDGIVDVNYCDYDGVMESGSAGRVFPWADTKPIIVGWVLLYIFDSHFNYHPPGTTAPGDFAPWLLPYDQNPMVSYDISHWGGDMIYAHSFFPVNSMVPSSQQFPQPTADVPVTGWEVCSPAFPHGWPLAGLHGEPTLLYPDLPGNFTTIDAEVIDWPSITEYALPGVANFNCPNVLDPSCYDLSVRPAQYGCGGMRFRIDCNSRPLFADSGELRDLRPSLVESE